jgi:cell shape-determining protein MreC
MDSKLKCVFVMPDNNMVTSNGSAPSSLDHAKPDPYHAVSSSVSAPPKPLAASSSPKVSYADADGDRNSEGLKKSIDEIKRLQEEVSALRQDNLQLKEEALRQKRLASSRSEAASSVTSSNRNEAFSVSAMNPDATALSTTYIYAALVVLVLGIIIGKWIF